MEHPNLWEQDAKALAQIGAALLDRDLPRVEVRLPVALADLAVAAWERDDEDNPVADETAAEYEIRHYAATIALIGLSIEQLGRKEGGEIVVELSPDLIGDAIRASDWTPMQ